MLAALIAEAGFCLDVINFRLKIVIIPRWFLFRSGLAACLACHICLNLVLIVWIFFSRAFSTSMSIDLARRSVVTSTSANSSGSLSLSCLSSFCALCSERQARTA